MTTITEVKRRLDGTVSRFECELVSRTRALVIAVYRFDDPMRGVIDSYGLFWERFSYLCYHMVPRDPAADVRTRFDVIRGMRFSATKVEYTDLLLDLWVEDGQPRWENEEEVEAMDASGRLSFTDRARIARTREFLAGAYPEIVGEVQRLLRAQGIERV